MDSDEDALRIRNVSKLFRDNRVLSNVELGIRRGEVHGLLGENGSGKSTLIKILAGYHSPEPGASLDVFGKAVNFPIGDSRSHGIAIVHQDLGLVDSMSVAENFGITTAYGGRAISPVNWRRFGSQVRELLDLVGVKADVNAAIETLSPADRTLVAVARARFEISRQNHDSGIVFVLDEPTALLSFKQSEALLESLRNLTDRGDSVLLVTHKLPEMLDHTDRVSVLRDGVVVGTHESARSTRRELVDMMLGRGLAEFYGEKASMPTGDAAVSFSAVGVTGTTFGPVDFEIRCGEIVGFTGVAGSGYEELPAVLVGTTSRAGSVFSNGKKYETIRQATMAGVGYVPGDRRRRGVWLKGTVQENITIGRMSKFTRLLSRLDPRSDRERATVAMREFDVRPMRADLHADALSGGNQQKVVLAKVMMSQPATVLLEEPTQGVDAGARKQILDYVASVAEQGVGVCVFSSDFEQLGAVCHRILVFEDGSITKVLNGSEVSENAIWEAVFSGSDS